MTTGGATASLEIERKYDVTTTAVPPSASDWAEVGLLPTTPHRALLHAVYFDTPDALLGRAGIAVRRRDGGGDQGWHLKEKSVEGTRELHWPLADDPPSGLIEVIDARFGPAISSRLGPIAELRTERTLTRLRPAPGAHVGDADPADAPWVIEFADDQVSAPHSNHEWREWEAELAPGADPAWLTEVEHVLRRRGATRLRGTSKLQRALGLPANPVASDPH